MSENKIFRLLKVRNSFIRFIYNGYLMVKGAKH